MDISDIAERLERLLLSRDWEQFHTPKNLAMAPAGEVGELLDVFQWLTPEESHDVMSDPRQRQAVEDELADVQQYVIRMADLLGVDLGDALFHKLERNAVRYPADVVRGTASKRKKVEDRPRWS